VIVHASSVEAEDEGSIDETIEGDHRQDPIDDRTLQDIGHEATIFTRIHAHDPNLDGSLAQGLPGTGQHHRLHRDKEDEQQPTKKCRRLCDNGATDGDAWDIRGDTECYVNAESRQSCAQGCIDYIEGQP